ncbi:unnamed protein product, partial [Discosporangium mesarthrocarpum]
VRACGTPYTCKCGYVYVVGNCGQPMEQRVCARKGCGRMIGGREHRPAPNNSTLASIPEARGYILDTNEGTVKEASAHATRGLSAKDVAATRLIMHLAGVAGAAAGGKSWAEGAQKILNDRFVTLQSAGRGVAGMFAHQADTYWKALQDLIGCSMDDTGLAVHLVLVGEESPMEVTEAATRAGAW